jgi:hypothetical protein
MNINWQVRHLIFLSCLCITCLPRKFFVFVCFSVCVFVCLFKLVFCSVTVTVTVGAYFTYKGLCSNQ